jgi:hypothetical protein
MTGDRLKTCFLKPSKMFLNLYLLHSYIIINKVVAESIIAVLDTVSIHKSRPG